MKDFINKKTSLKGKDGENVFYLDLINMGLNVVISNGMNSRTMKAIISLQETIGVVKSADKIKLSEDDVSVLKICVESMEGRWTILSQDVLDFINDVNSL